ncbi:unnamed protein product [Arctogadus glacialis]
MQAFRAQRNMGTPATLAVFGRGEMGGPPPPRRAGGVQRVTVGDHTEATQEFPPVHFLSLRSHERGEDSRTTGRGGRTSRPGRGPDNV